jgi:hypothetical protein
MMKGVRGVVEHKPVGETNWEYRVGNALGWNEETSQKEKLQGYGMLSYYRPTIQVMLKVESAERLQQKREKQDLIFTKSYVDDVTKKRSENSEEKTDCLEKMIQALQKLTLQERNSRSTGQELPGEEANSEQRKKRETKTREVYPEAELIEKEGILETKDTDNLTIATEECTQRGEHLEVGTAAPDQDERIQQEIQERTFFDIWMEFVYSERIQEGMYNNLVETNKKGCKCGKGRMSFPHWPPTSLDEAKALFNNCLDKENTHRRYIARSWWAFVARIAAIKPWKQQIKQEIYPQKEREIRERCGIQFDDEIPEKHHKRRKADCQGICEPTVRKQRYACLCDCGHHREECPVHQKNF